MEKDLLGWLCRQFSLLSDDLSFQHSCAFKPRSLTQVEASAAINTLPVLVISVFCLFVF